MKGGDNKALPAAESPLAKRIRWVSALTALSGRTSSFRSHSRFAILHRCACRQTAIDRSIAA